MESVSKGCTTNAEQVVLYCNTLSFDSSDKQESSSYAIECCEENFCNNGSFPILPSTEYSGNCLSYLTWSETLSFVRC